MQHFFSDFNFTRKARSGALAMLLVLFLLVLIWRVIPAMAAPQPDKDEIALQAAWSAFQEEHIVQQNADGEGLSYGNADSGKIHSSAINHSEGDLFSFDPNTASEADLLRLGLPKYTVSTILKFRAKNPHTFKKKEDLQKLYTLKKEDYERIAPYVNIPENTQAYQEGHKESYTPRQPVSVELNSANAGQLMSLRGIGPGFSSRIIKFRDILGGFYKIEQLKEVYGFPDSTYQQLKDKFSLDLSLLKKININAADENILGKHPYIGRKLAADIVKLRNDIGQFKDLEQLKQVPLINDEKYRKIAPYLSIH